MNRLDYVNNLLKNDDLSDYIKEIEHDTLISPPDELKDKILKTCYGSDYNTNSNKAKIINYNFIFLNVFKVTCFSLIISLSTHLLVKLSFASNSSYNQTIAEEKITYKISDTMNSAFKNFSNFMLNYNLKGE